MSHYTHSITPVVWYTIRVDKTLIQMGEILRWQESHVICEFMAVEEGLSCEEQTYYAHSMNTMRVVEVWQTIFRKWQVMLQRTSLLARNISCQIRVRQKIRIRYTEQQSHERSPYKSELDYQTKSRCSSGNSNLNIPWQKMTSDEGIIWKIKVMIFKNPSMLVEDYSVRAEQRCYRRSKKVTPVVYERLQAVATGHNVMPAVFFPQCVILWLTVTLCTYYL